MAERLIHKVSEILTDDANYTDIRQITSDRLDSGDTILVYPGAYTDPNTANVDNTTIMGYGDKARVVFTGFTIPEGATGTITLKNLYIAAPGLSIGNSAVTVNVYDCQIEGTTGAAQAAALSIANAAITKGTAVSGGLSANSTLVVENSVIGSTQSAGGYGIVTHDYGTVTLRNSRVAADGGILSNAACTIEHSTFTGANAYVSTIAAVASAPAHTVRASAAAAANAGNNTETVVALIS